MPVAKRFDFALDSWPYAGLGRPARGGAWARRSAMVGDQIRKVYLDEDEDFSERQSYGRRVVTPVRYSTDPRDVGWVRQNIPCQTACPADTNVPAYIQMILENRYGRSYELNRIANVLPGTLGRICSRPCEDACRHGWPGNGAPVNICHLKRAAADHKPSGHRITENLFTPSGKRIAVVGAGSAGIAAAHDLSMLGHDVTIFEQEKIAGGMLYYGIPEFRLPRDVLAVEVRNALRLGVDLRAGVAVGNGRGRRTAVQPARGIRRGAARDRLHGGDPPAAARRRRRRGRPGAPAPQRRIRSRLPDGAAPRREEDRRQAGCGGRRRVHRARLRAGVAAPRRRGRHDPHAHDRGVHPGHQGGDPRGQARGHQDPRPAHPRRADHRRGWPADRRAVRAEPARRLARRRPAAGDPDRGLRVRRAVRHAPDRDRPEDRQRLPRSRGRARPLGRRPGRRAAA